MARKTEILKPKPSDTNRLAMYWLYHDERITLPWSSAKFLQDWSGKTLDIAGFLKTYNFGYFEFGRYVQENKRINMFYSTVEGCTILSSKLFFNSANLGMDKEVSVAYGARGQGGKALAFYDPYSGFINLTRDSGVGSFAHEYAHALDYILGSRYDTLKGSMYLTDGGETPLRRIVTSILDEVLKQFNEHNTKEEPIKYDEKEYWYRKKEVFARSFEAWVSWATKELQKDGYPYKADLLVRSSRYNNSQIYPSKFEGRLDDLFTAFCIIAGQAMNGKPLSELKKTTTNIKTQTTMIKATKKTKRTTRKRTTTPKRKTTRKTTKRTTTKRKTTAKKKTTTRKKNSCKR